MEIRPYLESDQAAVAQLWREVFPNAPAWNVPGAIAYAMAKDPVTGEQLVTLGDFLKHGAAVLILSFLVLWGWTFCGYWRLVGFE